MLNQKFKNKINILQSSKILIVVFFLVLCSMFYASCIRADDTDCDELSGDAKDECKNLEKKAKTYKDLIELKNKQQDTLAVQLQAIDRDQEKNRNELQKTQSEFEILSQKIQNLESDIEEKEKFIKTQKAVLSGLIQTYYEYDQQGILQVVLSDEDFSGIFSQADYIEQSGSKASEILDDILKSRDELSKNKEELTAKKEAIEKAKEDLENKKYNLISTEQQKQSLVEETQGEEEKYKKLLARVEEQQKELFNFSEASNADEVSASVSKYDKPDSNLASTSWYYSQKDSRWGSQRIGNSKSLMKDYGCAVTCVSMVFKKNGVSTTPGKMAKEKIFYYDLIKWPTTWSGGIRLISSINHGNISWSKIDSQIKKGNPVIVYIKKTNGRGGHYVVITGKDSKDYIVHDPYFGSNLYLGTSKALVGKIGADSKVSVDQMIIYE